MGYRFKRSGVITEVLINNRSCHVLYYIHAVKWQLEGTGMHVGCSLEIICFRNSRVDEEVVVLNICCSGHSLVRFRDIG